MIRRILIRPKASDDLEEIWSYTKEAWGVAQAEEYVGEFDRAFTRIAREPSLGSDRSYIRLGMRKLTVGSHAIFYFHDERTVAVSRILRARRDVAREL